MNERFHIAQLNVGKTHHPVEHPRMIGFTGRLAEINALAERTPGYVWRLQGESGDATGIHVFDDPLIIVNLTVWESIEQLYEFSYHTDHAEVFRLRRAWFEPWPGPSLVLWWIPAGTTPTLAEALARLERLAAEGPSPGAFNLKVEVPAASESALAGAPVRDHGVRMKDEIESRLGVLVGQPLIVSCRAADMEMFSFGDPAIPDQMRDGSNRLVSRYGLHVQCPWRIVCSGLLTVGYGDIREPKTGTAWDADFDPNELGTTLREELLEGFYRARQDRPSIVTGVTAQEIGDLRITLDDGCVLEVFSHAAAASREHWRFMDMLGGHLVVLGHGSYYLP